MTDRPVPQKSADAYRTISEVADELKLPQHVLRFWETRFPQVKPLKRAGGRRFYRPDDVALLRAIKALLYGEGYTIKGVQRLLQEQGARDVAAAFTASAGPGTPPAAPAIAAHRGGTTAMAQGQTGPEDPPARPPGADRLTAGRDAAQRGAAPPGVHRDSDDAAARLEDVLAEIVECTRLLIASRAVGDA